MQDLTKPLAIPVEIQIGDRTLTFHPLTIRDFGLACERIRSTREAQFRDLFKSDKITDETLLAEGVHLIRNQVDNADVLRWADTPDGMAFLLARSSRDNNAAPDWIVDNITIPEARQIINRILDRAKPDDDEKEEVAESKNGKRAARKNR